MIWLLVIPTVWLALGILGSGIYYNVIHTEWSTESRKVYEAEAKGLITKRVLLGAINLVLAIRFSFDWNTKVGWKRWW